MEIKLPKDKHALRIRHLNAFVDERLSSDVATTSLKVDVLHKFTGISKPRLYQVLPNDLTKLFKHLISIFVSIDETKAPPKEIEVGGQKFVLVDFEKAPSCWHADNEESDYVIDPVRLACICYIPKGSFYGQLDQHDNMVYPIRSRHELFTEEFPLEVYCQLSAFFLRKFNKSMSVFTAKWTKKIRRQKRRASFIGSTFGRLSQKK